MYRLIAALLFLTAGSAFSQKYFFRHLMILANTAGAATEMRTAYGEITFNGVGAYTLTGSQIVGAGAPSAFTANGTYTAKSTGYITISNPQRPGADLNAGLGQGAVVGSSTETPGVYDLFIAIQAPATPQSNASFNGVYDISALEFPQMRNAAIRLTANGTGSAGGITVTSKAASNGDRVTTSTIDNASYSVNADGRGTLTLNGVHSLWLSSDGALALFGSGLASGTTAVTSLPFPLTLGNVQVMVNSAPAPLYLASPGQISALVPINATGTAASIVVINNGQWSNTVEVPLARTSPGIFTLPPAGTGPGALLHANFALVNADSPARRGETVQLFLTGLGAVTPPIAAGNAGPISPLSLVNTDVKVYIGGRQAMVLFKGLAPRLAGLYQVNFTVPANAPTGSAIPLAIETPDAFHDMADIAVSN